MRELNFVVLRGVCQMPAYVAQELGYFRDAGLAVRMTVAPTAWMVPSRLIGGEVDFAVVPWTRVAAARAEGVPLTLICGSGVEEAAIVVRRGLALEQVRRVAVPQRGGIKDLTAMGLIHRLGWQHAELVRQPSGDGAILALVGQGADAASMVEPYATLMEQLGVGSVVQRTGDLWPGAPGCSLVTHADMLTEHRETALGVVGGFVRGAELVERDPEQAAEIAQRYIGVNARFIRAALAVNRPRVDALRQAAAMDQVMSLMLERGDLAGRPSGFVDLSLLDQVQRARGPAGVVARS